MTTTAETPRLAGHLLVGGVMLAIMAGWVYANHEPAPTAIVALLSATAALAVVVGGSQLRHSAAPSKMPAWTLIGLTAVAAVCGVWLASLYKLESLGESLGLAFFAVLTASAAIGSLSSSLSEEERWAKVFAMRSILGIAIAAVGALSLVAFFYLALIAKVGADFTPELLGLLIGGFGAFFAGLYLLVSGIPTVASLRLTFIIVGAALGTVIVLVAAARGILWNEQIFRGGIATFNGPEAWKFWLVAYLFLAGLGLVFASLNLALSQIRDVPELRQAVFGYRSILSGILMFVLLAFTVLFASIKAPYTYNWTKTRGITSLNAASKNLLSGLSEPTGVYVLMSPNHITYSDIRNFVSNCQAYTNKISVTYIDPKNEPRKFNELVTRFKEIEPDIRSPFEPASQGVLLVYGALPEDPTRPVPHMFIPDKRLFEFDQKQASKGKPTLILKAESEIMKELAFLAKKSDKQKIYLLQDDGALDMNVNEPSSRRNPSFDLAKSGAGKLVDRLRKDNFEVRGLSFGVAPPKDAPKDIDFLGSVASDKKINIPEDCDVLMILGPSQPLPRAGLDALERYMDRGGKVIAAVDVVTDARFTALKKSGVEDFVKKYGVIITEQVLFRLPQPQDQSYFGSSAEDVRVVLAETPAKPATLLAKQLQGSPLRLWSTRVVKPGTSARYQVEPLFVVNPKRSVVWADDSMAGLTDFNRYFGELRRTRRLEALYTPDPIPVAVTVTEGAGEGGKPRMVVFGDAEFLSNEDLPVFETNYDVIASSIEWMSERGFIGPRPKESSTYSFGPNADLNSMLWGALWTMLILIVMLGIGVWLARRK